MKTKFASYRHRKFKQLQLALLFALTFCGANLGAAQENKPSKVIFDTDMAIDDWSALLLLAKHPAIDLLAVTANGVGESRCSPALENIPKLLDLSDRRDVKIACGDHYPLDGYFAFPEPWRKQADTLSGVKLPPSKRPVLDIHAVELLHTLMEKNSDVVLVATGSLTNIAQWLEKYPQDKSKVQRLVIMGGAFDAPGNIIVPGFTDGHPNKHAEWNIFVDPKAAGMVFSSGLPIETVALDVTNQVKVTPAFARDFKASVNTAAAEFWDKVLDDNDWFIDSGEYYFWDVLAALVAIEPRFCQGDFSSVTVSFEPSSTPWQASSLKSIPPRTYNGSKRQHYAAASAGVTRAKGNNPPVKICRHTDAKAAFDLFTKTLNR